MKKNKYIFLAFWVLILFSSCHYVNFSNKIEKGVLDLHNYTFEQPVFLIGQWIFYPNKFVPVDSVFNSDSIPYIKNDKLVWDNSNFPNFGYGTFAVRIIAPSGTYAIKIIRIQTAYKIFINNKLVDEVGKIGKNRQQEIPKFKPHILTFKTEKDTIDLVIYVSNFHFRIGGIHDNLIFGKPEQLLKEAWSTVGTQLFIIGFIFILAFFNFWLFLFRRKEKASLYFSLAIILQIIYELVNSEMILVKLFPNIPWEFVVRLDFASNYLRFAFVIAFLYESFKEDFPKLFILPAYLAVGFFLTVFLKPWIFSQWLIYFIILAFLSTIFATVVLARRAIQTKDQIYIFGAIGAAAIILIAVFEALYQYRIIPTFNFAFIGIVIYILSFTYLNARRISLKEKYATTLKQNILIVDSLKTKLLKIQAFNLEDFLKTFVEFFYLEAAYFFKFDNDNFYPIAKIEKNKVDFQLIEDFLRKLMTENKPVVRKIKKKTQVLIYNLKIEGDFISLVLVGRNLKKYVEIFELLAQHIKNFYDNYRYYVELKKLNENLEKIVEERTQLAYKQKEELVRKTIELDEKLEELQINAQVIEELNKELEEQKKLIEQKNIQLEKQKIEIEKQRNEIENRNENIEASIRYAIKIQSVLFEKYQKIDFEHFVLNRPIDKKLGGDNWWLFNKGFEKILVLVDATGHSVAGAFLTFILYNLISEALDKLYLQDKEILPNKLISLVSKRFVEIMSNSNDAFFISVVVLGSNNIKISSFGLPVLMYRRGQMFEFIGKKGVMGFDLPTEEQLQNYIIQKQNSDIIYLFSDGYYNQLGKKGKFGYKNFKNLLKEIATLAFDNQKKTLIENFETWKNNYKQNDDVLILAIKL